MPLLEKKLFKRSKPPQDLKSNEDVFYCKATHEVFRNYDQFFERVILCNSLVWTCSMTGKSNMTFQEALESEENARISLKTFSLALKKPVLYLASLTYKSRLNDMCDDVFNYVKDRFFIGEEVEAIINGVKKSCEVTQVVLPERPVRTPAKSEKQNKPKDITPTKIKYEVVDYTSGRTSIVKPDNLSRPKGAYTKPRNKLLLKHHTHMRDGVFKVKESVSTKLQIPEFPFTEVFPGPLPSFVAEKKETDKKDKNAPRKKIVQGKLNFKKESMDERKKTLEKQILVDKQKMNAEKERQKVRDGLKKQLEDEKIKQKEEKLKEKEKKREEKKKFAEYLNSWKKPRDDLECDDLKDLPVATPLDCGIPPSCFGDAMMILEFLNTFSKQVQLKDVFPHGFTFEHIERALTETDIQGSFTDLLQLLLTALFRYQEAEHDVIDLKNKKLTELDNLNIDQAMDVAQITSTWPQKYHGTMLRNLPLDSFSVTEILRLHLLSSGHRPRVSWQNVVTPSEDPGLFFKMEEAELIKKLGKNSVFELDSEERCKILAVLTHQLLASDVLKYAIDEYADNTRPLRNQLKELRQNFARKRREEMSEKKKDTKEKDEPNKQGGTEVSSAPPPPTDEEEKENSTNLTPEEKEALEEKKAKEAARLKAEFERKEREIESQIRKLQSSFNLIPIGRDRAFRRYWVFQTVAGVFVEDDDPFKGVCLPKQVPQIQNTAVAVKPETSANSIKKYLMETDCKNGSSDKENEILRDIAIVQSELPFPSKNRKLSDLNPRVDSKKQIHENSILEVETCLQCVNKSEVQDNLKYCPHSKTDLSSDQCSANIDTCPVHNVNAPRTKWSFYYKEEDLDALINSLNSRGFRERSLKEALLNEKERIKELMVKCPINIFNRTLPQPAEQVRKSQRHQIIQNSSYAGMKPQDALELTLRDMILELEHRIFAGGLGSLKVSDRETWRATIEQGANRNLCDKEVKEELSLKDDIESDIIKLSLPVPMEKVIKDMATAMFELSQGIESKYLNPPLGDSDDQKKSRQKQDNNEGQNKKIQKTTVSPLERWQESLMQCVTTSQLFVHLGTLERSVAWSRSVLKAHCRICRRRGDAENMLLCDGCNRGHHLYCLKPPLKSIPEGDWFCLSCKPAEMPVSPKKTRKEENESEGEGDGESEGEEESAEEESESGEDEEEEEEDEEEEDSDEESTANSAFVQESCEACGDVGTLLCCDGCPLMYHAECVNLKRIPRGEWLCPKCSKKEDAAKKAQKHPSNGTYGTRSSTGSADKTKKKSNPTLKTKMGSKGTKRKYEDSFEEEFEPPAKKANNRDSAQNAARRRSKVGSDSDMLDYKACIDMLVELMRHPSSWPFLVPVSKKDAPGYHLKIKRPMDFGTIRSKLNNMKYRSNQEFVIDIYLVLHNCWLFNPKSSPEFKAAEVLHREIKKLFKEYEIADNFPANGHMLMDENEL